jgi:hypothetical protein
MRAILQPFFQVLDVRLAQCTSTLPRAPKMHCALKHPVANIQLRQLMLFVWSSQPTVDPQRIYSRQHHLQQATPSSAGKTVYSRQHRWHRALLQSFAGW